MIFNEILKWDFLKYDFYIQLSSSHLRLKNIYRYIKMLFIKIGQTENIQSYEVAGWLEQEKLNFLKIDPVGIQKKERNVEISELKSEVY